MLVLWVSTATGSAHYFLLTFFGFETFFFPEPAGTQFGTFLPFFIFMPT
jgi:hypothetical protein